MNRKVTLQLDTGEQVTCLCPEGLAVHVQDRCIFDNGQFLDIGDMVGLSDENPGSETTGPLPRLVRCETLQDQARARENELMAKMAFDNARQATADLNLRMRLVQVRYSFDRKLLLILFAADERVDFRELVKRLAGELRCRVELRQIGVRDEAALIGGVGPCGRVQCCASWLKTFDSVNVRMARTQRLSLNPGAISGMCGRLKCCLRYEMDQYREALKGLPREGAAVEGPDGSGTVVDVRTLARRVRVRLDDDRLMEYDVDDLRIRRHGPDRREPGGG